MSMDFFNSMPYSPNGLFLTSTHSEPGAVLSVERYKGEEEMVLSFSHPGAKADVPTNSTREGVAWGNPSGVCQWCFWAGLKAPKIPGLWADETPLRKLVKTGNMGLELCKMLVYCQGIAISWQARDALLTRAVVLWGSHTVISALERGGGLRWSLVITSQTGVLSVPSPNSSGWNVLVTCCCSCVTVVRCQLQGYGNSAVFWLCEPATWSGGGVSVVLPFLRTFSVRHTSQPFCA